MEYDAKSKIEQYLVSPKIEFRIIAWWIKIKNIDISNAGKLQAVVKRNIRIAKELIPYENDLQKGLDIVMSKYKGDYDIGLETIYKALTNN